MTTHRREKLGQLSSETVEKKITVRNESKPIEQQKGRGEVNVLLRREKN